MTARRVAVALVLFTLVVLVVVSPVRAWAISFVAWVKEQGPLAAFAYSAIYAVAAVLLIPASALTLGAGFVYGVGWGTVVVFPAAVLASLAAFVIARRFGRELVAGRASTHPRFGAIDRAVGRAGFKITLLLRLSPIVPFGLLNYGLGITAVRFRDYAFATLLGMLPGTFLYVYLGSLVTSATELATPSRSWLYWLGAALTITATAGATWIARRELRRELAEAA